jgi:N-acetylmuramoyl-L-alanine amidase
MKVCIDPGHGSEPGAISVIGKPEKERNLIVALMLEKELTAKDVQVLMTRKSDIGLSLTERCNMANNWGADIFISLHADSSGNANAQGHYSICSIHSTSDKGGGKLARLLVDEVALNTGILAFPMGNNGVWTRESTNNPGRDYYTVIADTVMPAVILERGFLSNQNNANLLFNNEFLAKQAKGIANAILKYFGVNPIPSPAEPPEDKEAKLLEQIKELQGKLKASEDRVIFLEGFVKDVLQFVTNKLNQVK